MKNFFVLILLFLISASFKQSTGYKVESFLYQPQPLETNRTALILFTDANNYAVAFDKITISKGQTSYKKVKYFNDPKGNNLKAKLEKDRDMRNLFEIELLKIQSKAFSELK